MGRAVRIVEVNVIAVEIGSSSNWNSCRSNAVNLNSRMGIEEASEDCSTGIRVTAKVGRAMGTVEAKGMAVQIERRTVGGATLCVVKESTVEEKTLEQEGENVNGNSMNSRSSCSAKN